MLLAELALNTFRDHLILEYEIPKWDGDLGRPTVFVPARAAARRREGRRDLGRYESQQDKHWFTKETFLAPDAAARDRVQGAERVRRGIPLPEARSGMTTTRGVR